MHNTSTATFILVVEPAGENIRLLKKTAPRTPVIPRSPLTVPELSFIA